jgi:hypothetical protein
MFKIRLSFCSGTAIELLRVDCSNGQSDTLTCVRGKTGGAYRGVGTFHWSSGVRAVASLFLRALMIDETTSREPMLSGGAKSLAASLDYAITKRPSWLLDMFGVSSNGRTHARRLFRVTNSHRKRGGPVSVSINLHVCPKDCIEVLLDGKLVSAPETLQSILKSVDANGQCAGGTNMNSGTAAPHILVTSKHLEAA